MGETACLVQAWPSASAPPPPTCSRFPPHTHLLQGHGVLRVQPLAAREDRRSGSRGVKHLNLVQVPRSTQPTAITRHLGGKGEANGGRKGQLRVGGTGVGGEKEDG